MKSALIIGHAGHELRVLKFIELFKPLVFVLTDGSGANGKSRIKNTKDVIQSYGGNISNVFGYFSDKEIYELILNGNILFFIELKRKINTELVKNKIDFVFGDACEGFNPTHDLCRYIINRCIEKTTIKNYDFLLDNSPCLGSDDFTNITLKLSDEDKKNRDELISDYPEIQNEVQLAKQKFGQSDFDYECLREIKSYDYKTWKTDKPFYEKYGEKKLTEGKYKDIITYGHLLHIAENI